MLPDFKKIKKKVWVDYLQPAYESSKNSDPLLSRVNHTLQHEGNEVSYQTVQGEIINMNYKEITEQSSITVEEVESDDFGQVVEKFRKVGESTTSQIAQYSFGFLSQVIDKTGNSVESAGKLTHEDLLRAIEKIDIDFDEETGQPSMPSLYIHPDMSDHVKKLVAEAESDPAIKMRMDQVMEKKKEEWRERENHRKLVD